MASPYDAALLGILQHEGQISNFLDVVCSFLFRKTDFFLHLTPDGKMGFPPGKAKKMYLAVFKHYDDMAAEIRERKMRAYRQVQEQAAAEIPSVSRIEEVVEMERNEDNVVEANDEVTGASVKQHELSDIGSSVASKETNEKCSVAENFENESFKAVKDKQSNKINCTEEERNKLDMANDENTGDFNKAALSSDRLEENKRLESRSGEDLVETKESDKNSKLEPEDDDPELKRMQKIFQANPESYNGAIRENYSWSQSITDVDARIKIPLSIRKGKEIKVSIQTKHLSVSYQDSSGQMVNVIDDDLPYEVNKEESMWTLVPGEHIHVNLEKHQERWWECLLSSEPKISTRLIDPSRPMTDLDDAAQAKVEELMYNERQKQLGLPQSHESKVHEMLKKAWDVEGSPFKGQPFDPSAINISSSNS